MIQEIKFIAKESWLPLKFYFPPHVPVPVPLAGAGECFNQNGTATHTEPGIGQPAALESRVAEERSVGFERIDRYFCSLPILIGQELKKKTEMKIMMVMIRDDPYNLLTSSSVRAF